MNSPFSRRKMGALDWFCLGAIAFYQRELSPRKGYRCAHARLHGGAGCSGFARDMIAQHGLRDALLLVRARFRDCKLAARTLQMQQPNSDDKNQRRRRWSGQLEDACCVDFSWFCCAESLFDGSACEAASCADASCAHSACADASCAEAACGCHSCF